MTLLCCAAEAAVKHCRGQGAFGCFTCVASAGKSALFVLQCNSTAALVSCILMGWRFLTTETAGDSKPRVPIAKLGLCSVLCANVFAAIF